MPLITNHIDGSFAVEIEGINLWEEPTAKTIEELRDLWSRHGVMVFRRQAVNEEELIRFSAHFGEVVPHTRPDWASPTSREITIVSNMKNADGVGIGGLGTGELAWHTDQSFVPYPATGCLLYAVELPQDNPDTSWANLLQAYKGMPDALKERAQGKVGVFDYMQRVGNYNEGNEPSEEIRKRLPPVKHAVVNSHPITGEKSLYLDPGTMTGIDGLEDERGRALLAELTDAATQPEYVYDHKWRIGDVVMWDNGFLLHKRQAFEASGNRLMKRTIIKLPKERHICPGPA
ncbi:MAG: TauD/TfdA family dioxygenase [Alphaproteobacteria bacterium]|nr:TauD/TfdA family dioxygenase [Alphaproteobacteria bacterium]